MTTPSRKADILVRIARFGTEPQQVEYTFIKNTRRGRSALARITNEKAISSTQVRGQLRIEAVLGKLLMLGCLIALSEAPQASVRKARKRRHDTADFHCIRNCQAAHHPNLQEYRGRSLPRKYDGTAHHSKR